MTELEKKFKEKFIPEKDKYDKDFVAKYEDIWSFIDLEIVKPLEGEANKWARHCDQLNDRIFKLQKDKIQQNDAWKEIVKDLLTEQ